MTDHARLAPSSGQRIVACPGSVRLEPLYPDVPQSYTAEGTLAHDLANMALVDGVDLTTKIGKTFEVDGYRFVVSKEMVDHVQGYVDFVTELGRDADTSFTEQKVRYGPMVFGDQPISVPFHDEKGGWYEVMMTPEEIGFGRNDWGRIKGSKITIVDLKYGYTRVSAEENEQGMLYALGVLYEFAWMGEFDEVEIIIYQPRVDPERPWNSWTVSVADLMAFAAKFREAALVALKPDAPFNPGEKQCQFCNAKAHCAARRDAVTQTIGAFTAADPSEFDQLPDLIAERMTILGDDPVWLGKAMEAVGHIEDWCKAIRAETERMLVNGKEVPGFKLVEGRQGNRKWKDPEAVEELFKKTWRLKVSEMYDFSLISPTAAEKVLKSNKARWAKVQAHIERAQGRPSVAPIEDKRPALTLQATAEDFV